MAIKTRLKTNSRLCKLLGVNGITLYPFIFIRDSSPSDTLMRHELIHVDQVLRKGLFSFYLTYVFEYLLLRMKGKKHSEAYHGISYEKEAYAYQDRFEDYKKAVQGARRSIFQRPDLFLE